MLKRISRLLAFHYWFLSLAFESIYSLLVRVQCMLSSSFEVSVDFGIFQIIDSVPSRLLKKTSFPRLSCLFFHLLFLCWDKIFLPKKFPILSSKPDSFCIICERWVVVSLHSVTRHLISFRRWQWLTQGTWRSPFCSVSSTCSSNGCILSSCSTFLTEHKRDICLP